MRPAILAFCVALSTATAVAQGPIVRASLEPAKGVIVGQPVRLVVEILVPNYFTGSPELPEFELENAIVVLPQETPRNTNEQVGGKSYAGIVETYTIYPQQAGAFHLPPAQIAVSYASDPPRKTEAHISLPPLSFQAVIPEKAQALSYFLPTARLTILEKWSSPLKNVRAGDTVERTVTVTATRMQAMLIPPLPFESPDGIRVYQEEPVVRDQKTDRGEFLFGQRTQSVKYLVQKEGDYTLPAIELKWWNLSTNRLVTSTLPAVHFVAVANPGYVAELPPEQESAVADVPEPVGWWARYKRLVWLAIPCSIVILVLSWLGWRYVPRGYLAFQGRLERNRQSEEAYFRKLQRACRRDDKVRSYHLLLQWIGKWKPGSSLEEFLSRSDNENLSTEVERLGASNFAEDIKSAKWSGDSLARLLKQQRRIKVAAPTNDLLSLNP